MFPPLFARLNASSAVKALLGTSPLRVWPFGEVMAGAIKPYAVWQIITGSPENFLAGVPDTDGFTTQLDVYGDTPATVRAAAVALRDALEPVAYIVSWREPPREPDTNLYRISFDVDWLTPRT
jgi:hypothetical protein